MKTLFNSKKSNSVAVVDHLLCVLKVKVNVMTLEERLSGHPEFPSLLAISDCLDELKIQNQSFKIEKAEYDPEDLLFPFIAHFPARGGSFVLVHHIKSGLVPISNEKRKNVNVTESQFLKEWSEIALHTVTGTDSGEKHYSQKRIKYALEK